MKTNKNNLVTLTYSERIIAANAGVLRQVENLKKNRQSFYGAGKDNDWQLHIEGCLGEFALAKYLNCFWGGKGAFRESDVDKYEVRTRSKDNYELILHPDDPDNSYFWLVCGRNGVYKIKGYILGSEGKRKEYWKDPVGDRPAYFVPQAALKQLPDYEKVIA